ncbi:MAG TPA: DUF2207 domain-containing protein [Terriglobales bacterium]|nr:DUF2207 domain-containing protein [Terriglobales bacterium]
MRKWVGYWFAAALLALATGLSAEDAPEWQLLDFHCTVNVADDGSAVVLERMELSSLQMGSGRDFHGIQRVIPVQSAGPLGTKRRLFLRVLRVADGDGNALPYRVRVWGGQTEIQVPLLGRRGESRTVEIAYFVHNAVRYNADHDEVHWNLTSGTLSMPADQASATVLLPDKTTEGVRAQGFIGGLRRGTISGQVNGASVEFVAPGAVGAHEPFVVEVVVPKGVFHRPWWPSRALWFVESNPMVLMPLVVFLAMLWIRRVKRRLPPVAVVTEYEPPPGLTPAEAGTLLTDRVEPRDITATLVDLAVRGYVRLEEDDSEGHRDYIIRLMKPRDQWRGLANHEIDMLFNTFYGGQWTKLSSLKLRFVVAVPSMRAGILNALIGKGMYRVDPVSAKAYRVAAVILAGVVLLAVQPLGWVSLYDAGPLAVALVAASTLIVYVMGQNLTAKSLKGMRACAEVEGFREFIERVDADRLQRASPKQVERCLPYAMALGVEHNWAEQFAGITQEWPEWLVVARAEGADPARWTRSLGSMAQEAETVFTARTRTGRYSGPAQELSHGPTP